MRTFKELDQEELRVLAAALSITKAVMNSGPMTLAAIPATQRGFGLLTMPDGAGLDDKPKMDVEILVKNLDRLDRMGCEVLREYSARIGDSAEELADMDKGYAERWGSEQK